MTNARGGAEREFDVTSGDMGLKSLSRLFTLLMDG